MGKCLDLNQGKAKRLLLNMLEKYDSKAIISFDQIVEEKLVQDPLQLFEAIDVLWNCNESVPRRGCHIWGRVKSIKSRKLKVLTYSELVQELKEEVSDLIYYGLTVFEPQYCKNKSKYCWFCNRAKNYLDCKGNNYPDLINMDKEIMKTEPQGWVDVENIGIRIGNAEVGTVIKCAYCGTKWDMDLMVHEYHYYPESTKSSRNQARDRVIKEWIENKDGDWYVCPFNCNFIRTVIKGDNK